MYSPKFTISNQILKNISTIGACREIIENAPIIPAYERKFKEEALVRTVHHGTHIEGNDLSLEQAGRVILSAKGETDAGEAIKDTGIYARERDVQEVINYRSVLDWLDEEYQQKNKRTEEQRNNYRYTEGQIKQIHKLAVYRIVPSENQGEYRKTQVVLRDSRTGEVTFRPPPAVEVPYLMEDFVSWINSLGGREIHPVLRAGIAHYAMAAIHPFVEGNGRTARAFATLILFMEGYDTRRLFSLEEYFDRDAESYYKTLIATSNQSHDLVSRDLTFWLEYFTFGLSLEIARVREKVKKLSIDARLKSKRGEQILLTDRQIRIVEYLSQNNACRMGTLRELFPQVSDDTVLRDMQALVSKGVVEKKGKTKGAVYELAT
ncbi:MAG: Fic family protein [Patescibacteria group bacterium]